MPGPQFRYDRWKRAGASDDQLLALAEAHANLGEDQQQSEGRRIDGVSDYDLAAELAGDRRADVAPDPADGTVAQVLEQVGDDPDLAREALDAESGKDKPRATLVSKLEAIIEAAPIIEPQAPESPAE